MSYNPSKPVNVSSNLRMRIPISTTQKWYYLKGSEDKDVEYGKIFIAVIAPLSNVTGNSRTTLVIRMRWVFEFSYPELPSISQEEEDVFASAPNYFTDSSSDWKEGKYLTFKWHEGGNIVEFPKAKPNTLYHTTAKIGYYINTGAIRNTQYAVCVAETTESGYPMLAPVVDKATGERYIKTPSDTLLLPYFSAGPWVSPENPPWRAQEVTVQLLLTRDQSLRSPMHKTDSVVKVVDNSTSKSVASLNKFTKTIYGDRGGDFKSALYGIAAQADHAIVTANESLNVLLQRNDYDPNDPQVGLLKDALSKMEQLSFSTFIPGTDPLLKVFNFNPVRSNLDELALETSSDSEGEEPESSPKP